MFDNPSFEFDEALKIDQLLFQLAVYEASKGCIVMPTDMDKMTEIQEKSVKKFNLFKSLIRNGEMTLLDLCNMVARKHGPFLKNKVSEEQRIEELINPKIKSSEKSNQEKTIEGLFNNIFSMGQGQEISDGNLKIYSISPDILNKFYQGTEKEKEQKQIEQNTETLKPSETQKGKKKSKNEKRKKGGNNKKQEG